MFFVVGVFCSLYVVLFCFLSVLVKRSRTQRLMCGCCIGFVLVFSFLCLFSSFESSWKDIAALGASLNQVTRECLPVAKPYGTVALAATARLRSSRQDACFLFFFGELGFVYVCLGVHEVF